MGILFATQESFGAHLAAYDKRVSKIMGWNRELLAIFFLLFINN
jgi:hypothetical protein